MPVSRLLPRLLFRFYEPTGGRVLVDGQDIAEATQDSLRQQIGMVPQETVLFNNSIHFNIEYARPGATEAEIQAAIRIAQLDQLITQLPEGMDTIVGERGLKLSGGELQRVAIARAILKKPKILIFDEATSSLDSDTEVALMQSIREAASGVTSLIIAHRLSTIVDADCHLCFRSWACGRARQSCATIGYGWVILAAMEFAAIKTRA